MDIHVKDQHINAPDSKSNTEVIVTDNNEPKEKNFPYFALVVIVVIVVVVVFAIFAIMNFKNDDSINQMTLSGITTTTTATTTNPTETIPVISDETVEYFPVYPYGGFSLVDVLDYYGVPSKFSSPDRQAVAVANGFKFEEYKGTDEQNRELVRKAKQGKLIVPSEELIEEIEVKISEESKQEEN